MAGDETEVRERYRVSEPLSHRYEIGDASEQIVTTRTGAVPYPSEVVLSLSIKDAAAQLNVPPTTLRDWLKREGLESKLIPGKVKGRPQKMVPPSIMETLAAIRSDSVPVRSEIVVTSRAEPVTESEQAGTSTSTSEEVVQELRARVDEQAATIADLRQDKADAKERERILQEEKAALVAELERLKQDAATSPQDALPREEPTKRPNRWVSAVEAVFGKRGQ